MQFNGKLTNEQKEYLYTHGLSEKKINTIETLLSLHKEGLTDYVDLVGDDLFPGPFFFYNLKRFGSYLDLEPNLKFSQKDKNLRAKVTFPIIQKFGKYFLNSTQILENRNELLAFSKRKSECKATGEYADANMDDLSFEEDIGITLPDEPVLYTLNHGFKDDVLASVLCMSRPFSLFFGSVPQFYNTFDGILAHYIGMVIIVNRKSKPSRMAGQEKLKKAIDMGLDVLISPEGVWNKNPHKLLEHFWPGVYRAAKETNTKVVPIVHYIFDPTQTLPKHLNPIHTVVDDPIDISYMPEAEALEYYRDVLASWYYIMMEKYGQSTRKALLNGHKNMADAYEDVMQGLMKTVDRYDTEFEKTITYRPKGIINPQDVFRPIAAINPTADNILHQQFAQELVKTRDRENYQGRF